MKGKTKHTLAISDIDIHEKSIVSLRASFEIEGIVFTDEEIRKMVYEVRNKILCKKLSINSKVFYGVKWTP